MNNFVKKNWFFKEKSTLASQNQKERGKKSPLGRFFSPTKNALNNKQKITNLIATLLPSITMWRRRKAAEAEEHASPDDGLFAPTFPPPPPVAFPSAPPRRLLPLLPGKHCWGEPALSPDATRPMRVCCGSGGWSVLLSSESSLLFPTDAPSVMSSARKAFSEAGAPPSLCRALWTWSSV